MILEILPEGLCVSSLSGFFPPCPNLSSIRRFKSTTQNDLH